MANLLKTIIENDRGEIKRLEKATVGANEKVQEFLEKHGSTS